MDEQLEKMCRQFAIEGKLHSIVPFGQGHINRTFLSTWTLQDGVEGAFVHQRINTAVFKDVQALMRNIDAVTTHIKARLVKEAITDEKTLEIVPTKSGQSYACDDGTYWRTYRHIDNTVAYDVCTDLSQARETARVLGRFQEHLIDLDPRVLAETIFRFTSSPYRFELLSEAIAKDAKNRVASVAAEINFALKRQKFADMIEDLQKAGKMPQRVTHNDVKLNNVLFDAASGRGVCIVDLDTCMPGYSLFDFGDMVRCTAVPSAEDERDLSKVRFDLELFRAQVNGYLDSASRFLSPIELEVMHLVPRLVALTLGVRFLTDHINGDLYFRIHREGHNLDRARTQLKAAELMEAESGRMRSIIDEALSAKR